MTTVFYSARDKEMHVTTTDADSRVVTTRSVPVADKPAAIAYAKSIGARFTA